MPETTRPGAQIRQIRRATPAVVQPSALLPVIAGVCKEIVPLRTATGLPNGDALYTGGSYTQRGIAVAQAALPSPRSNIEEVVVENDTLAMMMGFGGRMIALPRGSHGTYGTAFLADGNKARKAAIRSTQDTSFEFDNVVGDILIFCLDKPNPADESGDIRVVLVGEMTVQEVADAINLAAGANVATVEEWDGDDYLQIASPSYGAGSSVTIRNNCSALPVLFGSGVDSDILRRVVGSGFCALDDNDGDRTSPWITFYRGAYLEDGVVTDFPGEDNSDEAWPCLIDLDGTRYEAIAPQMTFRGSSPTIALRAATSTVPGDVFFASGAQAGGSSAEVIQVESTRFKIGTINPTLSTYADGVLTRRVYTTVEFALLIDGTPFAPSRAWFQAGGLRFGDYVEGDPAVVAGDASAAAARPAMLLSSSNISFPLNAAGLTLILTLTVDNTPTETVFTFPGVAIANIADLVEALDGAVDGVIFSASGTRLMVQTTATGSDVALALSESGTANTILRFSTETATSDSGLDPIFSETATVQGTTIELPIDAEVLLEMSITDRKGVHNIDAELDLASYDTMGELATAIASAFGGSGDDWTIYDGGGGEDAGGIPVATIEISSASGSDTGRLRFRTIEGGDSVSIEITAGVDDGFTEVGFEDGENNTDSGNDALTGEILQWQVDGNPTVQEATLTSDSLLDAISAINLAAGQTIASVGDNRNLRLASTLAGTGSRFLVRSSDAATVFDLSTTEAVGSGRPLPDFYIDDTGTVQISPSVLRNPTTGLPYAYTSVSAPIYIAYKGIRQDVTSRGASFRDLMAFDSLETAESVIGPFSTENPLGLAVSLAIQAAVNRTIYAIGIDEANASAPEGTYDGWGRALTFLGQKEVHTISVLTSDPYVRQAVTAHVAALSEENARMERVCILADVIPSRAADETIASGTGGETNGTDNSFTVDVNPGSALEGADIDTSNAIPVSDNLYLEMRIADAGSTALYRYSVSAVNGSVLTLRTTFTGTQNNDGFFATTTLAGNSGLTDQEWSIRIRGDLLLIAGSTEPDLDARANAAAAEATAIGSARAVLLAGDSIDVSIDGSVTRVPIWYATAVLTGMIAGRDVSRSLTNERLVGVGRVYGTDDAFGPTLLSRISDAGRLVLVADNAAAATVWRAMTTDISDPDLENALCRDTIAKRLRTRLGPITSERITNSLLGMIGTVCFAVMQQCIQDGLCAGIDQPQVAVSPTDPREIIVQQPYIENRTLRLIIVELTSTGA